MTPATAQIAPSSFSTDKPASGISAYILAGGKSSRFGSDKARAPFGGRPLICHVADAIAPLARPIVIADRAGKYGDLGLETIADISPGLGPLAGLQTALHHCGTDWLLLVSCDLLSITTSWIETLASARSPDADAVAFADGYWEPLCAFYHSRLQQAIDRRIETRELAMQSLLDDIRSVVLPRPTNWAQANTPEEMRRATMKTFTILVFGPVAKSAGDRQVRVQSPAPTTCGQLREELVRQAPAIAPLLPSCRFAVDGSFVPDSHSVAGDEEIALIGLVSGG